MRLFVLRSEVKHRQARRNRHGFTLIETAITLGILAVMMIGVTQLLADAAETNKARITADRLSFVSSAAKEYVRTNFVALMQLPDIQAGRPVRVNIGRDITGGAIPAGPGGGLPSVQGGGFLPSTYVDKNAYAQSHALILRPVTGKPDRLEGIVTALGGSVIPDLQLGRIATMVGADGGFMLSKPINGTANQVTGVAGGWITPANNWTVSGAGPTIGRVQTSLAFNEGAMVGDYLYRTDIGIPEANRMRTNLSLGGNNITNVTEIKAEGDVLTIGPNIAVAGYITAGTDIKAGNNVEANNNVTAKKDVAAGGNVTAVANVTAGAIVRAGTDVIAGARVRGTKFEDTNSAYSAGTDSYAQYVDPSGTSVVNDILAQQISADAVVYSSDGRLNKADGIKLKDMLPRYVAQGGYIATAAGPNVPKPTCAAGGTPKITLASMVDSSRFNANLYWLMNSTSYFSGVSDIALRPTDIARGFGAVSNGALSWRVSVSGTPQAPGVAWQAYAMTFCYY